MLLSQAFVDICKTESAQKAGKELESFVRQVKDLANASEDQNLLMAHSFLKGLINGFSSETEILELLLQYDQAEVGGYTSDGEHQANSNTRKRLRESLNGTKSLFGRLEDNYCEDAWSSEEEACYVADDVDGSND